MVELRIGLRKIYKRIKAFVLGNLFLILAHDKVVHCSPWIPADTDINLANSWYFYDQEKLEIYQKISSAISKGKVLYDVLEKEEIKEVRRSNIKKIQKSKYIEANLPRQFFDFSFEVADDIDSSTGIVLGTFNYNDINAKKNGSVNIGLQENKSYGYFGFFKKYVLVSELNKTFSLMPYFRIANDNNAFGTKFLYGKSWSINEFRLLYTFTTDIYRSYGSFSDNTYLGIEFNTGISLSLEDFQFILEYKRDIMNWNLHKKCYKTYIGFSPERFESESNITVFFNFFTEERYNFFKSSGLGFGFWLK